MAQRLQHKRSSIPGKRPDRKYLEPGELAVNTNSLDPGLFFEANDGSIVKVGPVAVTESGLPPALAENTDEYTEGELWLDAGVLKVFKNGDWKECGIGGRVTGNALSLGEVTVTAEDGALILTNGSTGRSFRLLMEEIL